MRNIFDHPAYDAEGPVSLPGGYRRRLILDRRSNGRGQVEGRGTTLQALVFEPMAPEDDGEVGRHLQEYAAGDPQQQGKRGHGAAAPGKPAAWPRAECQPPAVSRIHPPGIAVRGPWSVVVMIMLPVRSRFLPGQRLVAVGGPIHFRRREAALRTRSKFLQQTGIGFGQDAGLGLDLFPELLASRCRHFPGVGAKGGEAEQSGEGQRLEHSASFRKNRRHRRPVPRERILRGDC